MQNFIKLLEDNKACEPALSYCNKYKSPKEAWDSCTNTDWMLWYLNNVKHESKETFVKLARIFADHVKHLSTYTAAATAATAYAAYAADAYAAYAAATANAAAAYAYAYAYATTTAAYATYTVERKYQCNQIRILFPNP